MAVLTLPVEITQELSRIAELERRPITEVMVAMIRQYTPLIDPDPDPQLQVMPLENGWGLAWVGESQIIEKFESKDAALDAGKALARTDDVVLLIHSGEGYIEDRFDPDDEKELRPEVQELLLAYQRGELKTITTEELRKNLGLDG